MKRMLVIAAAVVPLLLLAVAFSPGQRAQGRQHLNLRVAFSQENAPVHIKSVTHKLRFYYGSASVENLSQQTIREITFGVLLHAEGQEWSNPTLASRREIATNLNPGETRSIDIDDAAPPAIRQRATELKSSVIDVEFGVLAVQFADGSSWQYDWQGNGAFDRQNMPGAKKQSLRSVKNCNEIADLLSKVPGISAVLAQEIYSCGTSVGAEYCTNNLTSCTVTECPKGKPCPFQGCNGPND